MKNNFKRLTVALVFVLVLIQVFTLFPFADDYEREWEVGRDGIYFGDEKYVTFDVPIPYYIIASEVVMYEMDYDYSYYDEVMVSVNGKDPENRIAWIDALGDVYVSERAKAELDSFFDGDVNSFMISDMDDAFLNGDLEKSFVEGLDAAYRRKSGTVTVDVRELKELKSYNALAVDDSKTLAYDHGAFFELDGGEIGYVCYGELGNQYFDADGYFSFRSGEVELLVLDGELLAEYKAAKNGIDYNSPDYIWGDDDYYDDYFGDGAWAGSMVYIFWVCFILLGFIFPLPFIIVGLILPRTKKLGRPKYWYLMSIVAGIWLLLSAVLLAIILLIA